MKGLPPWSWVLGSMLSIQFAAAFSIPMLDAVGASTVAWLRLCWAAVLLIVFVRPFAAFRDVLRGKDWTALALGAVTAGMTLCYFEAIARLPLGMANAVEFMGPLSVAALSSHRRSDFAFVALAALGVVLVLQPSAGWVVEPIGLGFSIAAAVGWAAYILLTKRVGARHEGMAGLAIAITVAALVATPVGLVEGWGRLQPIDALAAGGLAILSPLVPYALEMAALRRLRSTSFGILMSLEPVVAMALGYLVLGQQPELVQLAGVVCVVAASIGTVSAG